MSERPAGARSESAPERSATDAEKSRRRRRSSRASAPCTRPVLDAPTRRSSYGCATPPTGSVPMGGVRHLRRGDVRRWRASMSRRCPRGVSDDRRSALAYQTGPCARSTGNPCPDGDGGPSPATFRDDSSYFPKPAGGLEPPTPSLQVAHLQGKSYKHGRFRPSASIWRSQNCRVRDISRVTSSRRRSVSARRSGEEGKAASLSDRRQVRAQERCLIAGSPLRPAAEQDHGRLRGASLREQRAEVGVSRNDDSILGSGSVEDLGVACGLQLVLPDVHRVVAGGAEFLGNPRRQRIVDQESQPAGVSGSSRSRTASAAYLSASVTSSGSRSGNSLSGCDRRGSLGLECDLRR